MTVDLNVLDHLGINLYSNAAAVLTEAVANAWDADANKVDITIGPKNKWIRIEDDGVGMSVEDMNEKYLRVGYKRREMDKATGTKTHKGRPVMGRKGLGKLSLFSIAETIEVQSIKDGEAHGLRMTVEGIHASVAAHEDSYSPEPLNDADVTITQGSCILLQGIKRQRLGKTVTALRKRLARRFSIFGTEYGFTINIDGKPVTPEDREDLKKVQFLWEIADSSVDTSSARRLVEQETLAHRINTWDPSWAVKGWLGTVEKPKDLDSDEVGNLNGIVVFARGRLFHENILEKLNDGRLYTKYLTGQIEADFLDMDDQPDIATSDRQRVQEDDPRYTQLIVFLRSRLTDVEKRWNEWRRKHEVKKAKEMSPVLEEWIESLALGFRDSAEKMIANLSALPVDHDEDKKVLIKHGILAFERMKLRGSTETFVDGIDDIEMLLSVLADRDVFEASLYRDIVKSRLEAIRNFQGLTDENEQEKVLQKYLFEHLWLLDPAWERATASEVIESRLKRDGVIVDDLTRKEERGRVDIAYRTNAGKHIIVELKRAGRRMTLLELVEQGQLYVDKLTKILAAQDDRNPNIEVVFVIGRPLDEESSNPTRLKSSMEAISPGSRVTHYDALIEGARNAYSAYLEQSLEVDRVDGIVARI